MIKNVIVDCIIVLNKISNNDDCIIICAQIKTEKEKNRKNRYNNF